MHKKAMCHAGSCIIFTAALSVLVLKRRLNWLHITGELLCNACMQTIFCLAPSSLLHSLFTRICAAYAQLSPAKQSILIHVACVIVSHTDDVSLLAGIVLTLMAVVIVSLVNIIYPPSPCPRSDPACMSAHGPDPHSSNHHILLGIMLTLAAQGFQVRAQTHAMLKETVHCFLANTVVRPQENG